MGTTPVKNAATSEKFTDLKSQNPPKNSVGLGAIKAAFVHAKNYMNLGDALKISTKINQKGGFDCPGCAWPDPDDERSILGEYCENGMKAMAEEAQNKTIGADFFANNSVNEIAQMSDFEIGKSGRLSQPMYLGEGATHYQPLSWNDAFAKVGSLLSKLANPLGILPR